MFPEITAAMPPRKLPNALDLTLNHTIITDAYQQKTSESNLTWEYDTYEINR